MKLKNTFIIHESEEGAMLVPTGGAAFSGLVRGNRTLGAILTLLKEETTEEAVVEGMKEQFDAPGDVLERDVRKVLDELRKIGALDE